MDYFGIDIAAIQERCKEVGIKHVRFPVRDFDPFDLRMKLPKAASKLARAHDPRTGIAYIHCTAGRACGVGHGLVVNGMQSSRAEMWSWASNKTSLSVYATCLLSLEAWYV
jgi:hypothetical protein